MSNQARVIERKAIARVIGKTIAVPHIDVVETRVANIGVPGPRGPQGIQGPRGLDGLASIDKTYVHMQEVPANVWFVSHNLGKYPSVAIVDSAGSEVEGEVLYLSMNYLMIQFSAALSGKAYIN